MLDIDRILYATDFSERAHRALCYALALALHFDARLDVLHATPSKAPYPARGYDPATLQVYLEARLQEVVLAQLERLHPRADEWMEIHYVVLHGVKPASAITSYAESEGIDLIVLGTHGRRGVKRLMLGSVAEEVVHTAPCAVLTVRADESVVARMIECILVPIDFSSNARLALLQAKELAAFYGARLDLLHVVLDPRFPELPGTDVTPVYGLDHDIKDKVTAELTMFYNETGGPEAPVHFHVRNGTAAEAILGFANKRLCDLIVMSTQGLEGLARLFLGSVSDEVLRQAPCPVLTMNGLSKSLDGEVPEAVSREAEMPPSGEAKKTQQRAL